MVERYKQIDGLRGVMAIVILVFHLFYRYLQIYEISNIYWMSQWGTFGVVVFLLISGFFMGLKDLSEETNNKSFKFMRYLKKKVIRLWICYAISITITMIIVKIFNLPGRECTWIDYFLNLFLINGFIGITYVDGAHWYLTTLLSIIIIIGIIKKLNIHKSIWTYIVWLTITFILIKIGYGKLTGFIGGAYLGVALTGISIAKIDFKKDKKYNIEWLSVFLFSILFCLSVQGILNFIILLIGIICFLLCLNNKIKFLENKIFIYLNTISYPLYLIHQNVGYVIINQLTKINNDVYMIYFSFIASVAMIGLSILICFIEKKIKENKWYISFNK